MARAVSTVLDVALCLLLVGVAVGTLTAAIPNERAAMTVDSDSIANSVLTETAAVSSEEHEIAHATLAEHLAQATVLNATLDGERLTDSPYPDAVRHTVEERTESRVHITARWEPYPESPLRSTVEAGPTPPSTADTAATSVRIDGGMATAGSPSSFRSLAESIASAYVDRLFPPERTRVRLVDSRTATATGDRYREMAGVVGTDIEPPITDASSRRANERLKAQLTGRIEDDLRTAYETIESVPNGTVASDVQIVVRRWER
ncbi:MAG: DUF7284 family protein [Halobacteriota archaeon]|uniref:DUF7284 family protein n=1 Tax=Natronomonas sp. TaxID=2184060 RepID=UPI003974D73D